MASEVLAIRLVTSADGPYVESRRYGYAVDTPCVIVEYAGEPAMMPVIFGRDAALQILEWLCEHERELRQA